MGEDGCFFAGEGWAGGGEGRGGHCEVEMGSWVGCCVLFRWPELMTGPGLEQEFLFLLFLF